MGNSFCVDQLRTSDTDLWELIFPVFVEPPKLNRLIILNIKFYLNPSSVFINIPHLFVLFLFSLSLCLFGLHILVSFYHIMIMSL